MHRSNRSIRRICVLLVAVFAFSVAVPGGAFAQEIGPTDEQYRQGVLGLAGEGDPGDPGDSDDPAAAVSGNGVSELPFTGLDLALVAAIGVGLLGAGFAVRRAARTE